MEWEAILQGHSTSSLELCGNQFKCALSFHETHDSQLYEEIICYHNTRQQTFGNQL